MVDHAHGRGCEIKRECESPSLTVNARLTFGWTDENGRKHVVRSSALAETLACSGCTRRRTSRTLEA